MRYQPTRMRLDLFPKPSRQRRRAWLEVVLGIAFALGVVWWLGVV